MGQCHGSGNGQVTGHNHGSRSWVKQVKAEDQDQCQGQCHGSMSRANVKGKGHRSMFIYKKSESVAQK